MDLAGHTGHAARARWGGSGRLLCSGRAWKCEGRCELSRVRTGAIRREDGPEWTASLIAKSSTVAASTANEASVPPQATKLGRAGDRRLWIWAAPILLAAVFGALLLQHSSAPRVSPSVGFHATDERASCGWSRTSRPGPIRDAKNGKLGDSGWRRAAKPVEIALDSQHLKTGSVTYARKSGDLEARLTVYPNDGDTIQETTRFVGAPVVHPEEEEAPARETQMQSEDSRLRQDRDNLAGQVPKLKREELRKVNARNRELEKAVGVL